MTNKSKFDTASKASQRIARLRNLMEMLLRRSNHGDPFARSELAALEWAIPILEVYAVDKFGILPPERSLQGKKGTAMLNKIYRRDLHVCYLCTELVPRAQASVDHVIPLSKGGKDDETNYKLAHVKCNAEKGNMTLEDYKRFKARQLIEGVK